MAKLNVNFVTPKRDLLHDQVDQVVATSVNGQVTILPGHIPLLATLDPGLVELRNGTDAQRFAVSAGFLEVANDTVTILADTAEAAADIDVRRAQKAVAESDEKLKTLGPADEEYAEEAARVARNRVRAAVGATPQH